MDDARKGRGKEEEKKKAGMGGEKGNIPDPQLEFHLSTIYIYSNFSDANHSAP